MIKASLLWKRYKDKIVFIIFLLQITLFYKLIQMHIQTGYIFKISFIDDKIPFIPLFVMPYLLYAVVLLLPFILTFRNKKYFFASSAAFLFASLVCNFFFVLFPTMTIRPEIAPSDIFNKLVLWVYAIDGVTNLFPSEHVAFSVLSNLCLTKINKRIAYYLIPITGLIVFSTVFIKQHYIPDILGGLVLAFASFLIFKRIIRSS